MRALKKYRGLTIALCTLSFGILVLFLHAVSRPVRLQPAAQGGSLDLSGWDFEKNGNVKLDGEWEFYWNRLLFPKDFQAQPQADGYVAVPSAWSGRVAATQLSDKGVATYRLRVRLDGKPIYLGIRTASVRMSYRVFIDGTEVICSGNPAASPQEGYVAANVPYTAGFYPTNSEIDIVIQVADFDYKSGGIVQSIRLGTHAQIYGETTRNNIIGTFVSAFLFAAGTYYLLVYMGRRRNISALYFGIYCVLLACFTMIYGDKILLQAFPGLPFVTMFRLQNMLLNFSVIFVCLFVNQMAALLPKWYVTGIVCTMLGHSVAYWVLPLAVVTSVETLFLALSASVYLIVCVLLAVALVRNRCGSLGRAGATQLLIAFLCALVVFASGILYVNNVLGSNVGTIAYIVFVLLISGLLSRQYNEAYRTIESMNARLLELDKLKDTFLANTSHELRTPLNGIINITSAVIEKNDEWMDVTQRQNLQVVVASARRLHNLINDILDISSLKNGVVRLYQRPVDIRSAADLTIYLLDHLKDSKPIQLINSIPEGLPPVYADVERLRQILYNLIGNALKFTQEGRVEVGAATRADQVEIWVEDTGCGIASDKQQEIFQPFYQIDSTETREAGGTGLGLSITKTLVQLHGGTLWVDSREGIGSRFTFTLPISRKSDEPVFVEKLSDALPGGVPNAQTPSGMHNGQQHTILIADDDPSSLTALYNILDGDFYFVKAVRSGEDALRALAENPAYDLVILDVMMPKMSGYEVLKKIRARFRPLDIPVLLLTAKTRPEDLRAGFEAGANDYLAKPFEALELRARVKTLIQLKESVNAMLENRLSFLQAQIKPHFLYNALSVITSLSLSDPKQAKELLMYLSDYLRGSFNFENRNGLISLSDELQTVRAYLAIEKARFEERLHVEYEVEPGIAVSVPMLSLQPLVENAVRHGVMQRVEGGTVKVCAKTEEGRVLICVADDGVGMSEQKIAELMGETETEGVGIRNIHKRMLVLYGHGLQIESTLGRGTSVTMVIPFNRMAREAKF